MENFQVVLTKSVKVINFTFHVVAVVINSKRNLPQTPGPRHKYSFAVKQLENFKSGPTSLAQAEVFSR